MTILDSIMPTHAMLARAAVHSVPEDHPIPPPHFLKYIIVESPDGQEIPILFPADLQHRDALPEGLRPISAGFIILYARHRLAFPRIGSGSLRLDPRPQDRAILAALLRIPIDTGPQPGASANRKPKTV